ncbi:hypothetical protein EFA46_004625 [Halarchaeum sp. CBA1220]|uniref:DUF5305 family protein n=1 Tax=Halarchaeum sp. CBA1220 TaxID=1853682 RepID=UPI000F3A7F35|nr:DUF5305 family protein [Halarchaeum sp. CBA1220]QLC33514.1 hypothetical protein EFA46_004625 [Halarchaeum sp. CBA1220]
MVALCLLVGVLGIAAGGWVYTHPGSTQVSERTTTLDVEVTTHTSATIEGEDAVYPGGTRVRDRPVYFRSSTSDFAFSAVATPQTSGDALSLTQRIVVVRTASRNGAVFYRNESVLATASSANGTLRTSTALDVGALAERTDALKERVGDAGSVNERVVVSLTYRTPETEGTRNETVGIERGGAWFDVATPSFAVTEGETSTRTVANDPDALVAGSLAGGGSVVLLVGVALGALYCRRYRDADPEPYRLALVAYAYREWISEGTAPDDVGERRVRMDSLVDLVDVAIDTDRRVVHDAATGTYYVIDDVATYTYTPPVEPTDLSAPST